MKIENIDRAKEAIGELEGLEVILCKVKYALEPNVGICMFFKCYARNGFTKYKDDTPIYPHIDFEAETKRELRKYKKYLECRISELKKEIEKL